jgi:hypothetical protein
VLFALLASSPACHAFHHISYTEVLLKSEKSIKIKVLLNSASELYGKTRQNILFLYFIGINEGI